MDSVRKTLHPTREGLSSQELQEAQMRAEAAFNALSEEDQILYLYAARIGYAWSGASSAKEDVARQLLTKDLGPKFAERVLGDPDARKKLRLD